MGTLVIAHTYYLARWDRCYGERAHDRELCGLLKREWLRRAHDDEPTIVDGVSAWIDQDGVVRICLVQTAIAHMIADPELSAELAPRLAPRQEPLVSPEVLRTSEAASVAGALPPSRAK